MSLPTSLAQTPSTETRLSIESELLTRTSLPKISSNLSTQINISNPSSPPALQGV